MHLIIDNIDRVYTPAGNQWEKTWHGLETPVQGGILPDGSNCPDVFCPIVECGVKADFESEVSSVPEEMQEETGISLKNWKLILADCRQGLSGKVLPLHVPKKGYKIHQNKQLFDCMVNAAKQVLGDNGFEIVTLGTLGGYSQFFMSIAVKGQETFTIGNLADGKTKDTWNRFFNLNSSHNGMIASNRSLSVIRQVCWNTVNASITEASENGTITAIKHSLNSEELITPQVFARDLEMWIAQGEMFQKLLAATKKQQMTEDKFKSFAAGVFTNDGSDKLSTNSFNRISDMLPLFHKGMGNNGKTRYDGINAFTEYFSSGEGTGNPLKVKLNKRIATANFGRANEWKLEAMRVATTPEEFTATVKRGEMLYEDKAKEMAVVN